MSKFSTCSVNICVYVYICCIFRDISYHMVYRCLWFFCPSISLVSRPPNATAPKASMRCNSCGVISFLVYIGCQIDDAFVGSCHPPSMLKKDMWFLALLCPPPKDIQLWPFPKLPCHHSRHTAHLLSSPWYYPDLGVGSAHFLAPKLQNMFFFLKKLVVLENTVPRREVQVSLSFSCRLGRAKFFQNVFESLTCLWLQCS